jgi:hypothetical protein
MGLSARISVGFYRRHPVRVLVARRPVAAYLVLACATSWAWWLPMALTGRRPGWRRSRPVVADPGT